MACGGLPYAVDRKRKNGEHSRARTAFVLERIAVRRGKPLMTQARQDVPGAPIAEWVKRLPLFEPVTPHFDLSDDFTVDIRLIRNQLDRLRAEEETK